MYTPRSFKVEDLDKLHELISKYNFAVVFSQSDGPPVATHLPWMIDRSRGAYGTLISHMAKANPQWESWTEKTELLVVFQGPHSYISPAWYKDDITVPTWNYAAVHVYGSPRLVSDTTQLRKIVEDLIEWQESQLGKPWDSSKRESVMEVELKGIVGFEIEIERIEGKWKFNQNRIREDQEGVVCALKRTPNSELHAVAEIMEENLKNKL